MADLTAEELTIGIGNAIKAHDFKAAFDMLKALAIIDPHTAQTIYDALTITRPSATFRSWAAASSKNMDD